MRSGVLLLLCSFVVPLSAASSNDSIQTFIERQRSANAIPGIAVAVIQDGHVDEYFSGVANLEWGAPVTRDTKFQLASVTKMFTGVLVMRLVEAGKLDLDRSVTSYLPEAPVAWRAITVRMLADHTSGIPEAPEEWTPDTLEDVLDWAKDKELDWTPGAQARYGRNDFSILALVIERASGLGFEDALNTYLLEPAGLVSTGYSHLVQQGWVRTALPLQDRATVYHWDGAQKIYEFLYPEPTYAAGGLYSTIADVEQLLIGLQQGALLKAEHLKQLTTAATLNDGKKGPFGIGWVVHTHHGIPVAGHTGGPGLADVTIYPDSKLAVVVLQNQHKLYPWLSGAIVDKVIGLPNIVTISDADQKLTDAVLEALRDNVAGSTNTELWSRSAKDEFLPWFESDGRSLLRSMGDPLSAALVVDKQGLGTRARTYSVTFSNATTRWTVLSNEFDLLEAILPADE